MADDFDLGDIYASLHEQEEARKREAEQARQEAEEARRKAEEAQRAEAQARQEAQRRERQTRLDELAAMHPARRWVMTHKVATGVSVIALAALVTIVSVLVISARQEEQRFQDLLASCDVGRTQEIAPADLRQFVAVWSTCAAEDPRVWAATQAGPEDANILVSLAADSSAKVRLAVVTNAATPASAMTSLAADSEESIRLVMAERQVELDRLAADPSAAVRVIVANASNLSDSAMEQLAQDSNLDVKRALLERSDLGSSARLALAKDANPAICSAAADGLRIPAIKRANPEAWAVEMLQAASSCGDTDTRVLAADLAGDEAPSILTSLADDEDVEVRQMVAERSQSAEVLTMLSNDPFGYIRGAVARNRSTPPEVLTKLSTDSDPDVRRGVAFNFETPAATAEVLATDTDYDVRVAISKRPDVTPTALDLLASAPEPGIRLAIAGNANAPASALIRLATDAKPEIQSAVVRNPGATTEVLLVLCASDRILIRGKARDRIEPEFYRQCLNRAIYR